jgi:hypothetical protein
MEFQATNEMDNNRALTVLHKKRQPQHNARLPWEASYMLATRPGNPWSAEWPSEYSVSNCPVIGETVILRQACCSFRKYVFCQDTLGFP